MIPQRISWAATVLLVVCGPLLAFPDVIPAPMRTPVITVLALASFAMTLYLLRDAARALKWGLALFLLAVIVSWTINPRDLPGVRHFAGVALGVLLMAVVAHWSTTTPRRSQAAILFTLLAIAVLGVGLASTSVTKAKLLVGATPIETGKLFPWLPARALGLPGLEGTSGRVNPNALAGTALMLLPACAGIAAAGLLAKRFGRVMLALGVIATVGAVAVLSLTRSRTALLAALLTLVIAALRWRRGRWWIAGGLLALTFGVALVAMKSRSESPEMYAQGVRFMRNSVLVRVVLWQEALPKIQERPLFGIGMSRFRNITPQQRPDFVYDDTLPVPHAHNIFIQVALDIGVIGLCGYLLLFGALLVEANRAASSGTVSARIAAGAGLSLVAVHLFGTSDAIALGAKVGAFQWFCAGLVLACARPQAAAEPAPVPIVMPPPDVSDRIDDVAMGSVHQAAPNVLGGLLS